MTAPPHPLAIWAHVNPAFFSLKSKKTPFIYSSIHPLTQSSPCWEQGLHPPTHPFFHPQKNLFHCFFTAWNQLAFKRSESRWQLDSRSEDFEEFIAPRSFVHGQWGFARMLRHASLGISSTKSSSRWIPRMSLREIGRQTSTRRRVSWSAGYTGFTEYWIAITGDDDVMFMVVWRGQWKIKIASYAAQ